jgi:16S rRNA (guanine(966)-N(2))-methyltransferase RsmD
MRIISGSLKSIRFQPPKGFNSRPTTDFAKEALFNVLEHRLSLLNLSILDLCAGTGSISFEFASREAGEITAVDSNFKCIRYISTIAEKYEVDDLITPIKADVIKFLQKTPYTYDLIFADPPFDSDIHKDIVALVYERKLLNPGGLMIIEHSKHKDLSGIAGIETTRKYGGVQFSFFNYNDNE